VGISWLNSGKKQDNFECECPKVHTEPDILNWRFGLTEFSEKAMEIMILLPVDVQDIEDEVSTALTAFPLFSA